MTLREVNLMDFAMLILQKSLSKRYVNIWLEQMKLGIYHPYCSSWRISINHDTHCCYSTLFPKRQTKEN